MSTPSTPRLSVLGNDDAAFSPDMGSRFFVDQIQGASLFLFVKKEECNDLTSHVPLPFFCTGLRAARRTERLEFQHELEAQKAKMLEALRVKDELSAKVAELEKKVIFLCFLDVYILCDE